MMRNRSWTIVTAAGLLTLLFVAAGHFPLNAEDKPDKKPSAAGGNPFQGKVLMIYFKSKSIEYAYPIEEVSLTEIAGRQFLAGKWVKTNDPPFWGSGLKGVFAVDDISSMIEFDSVEDYVRRAGQQRVVAPAADNPAFD